MGGRVLARSESAAHKVAVDGSVDPKAVFINCPFDAEFEPLFDALVLVTVCCRFTPRSALEASGAGSRLERIVEAIRTSKYSIHDLSRYRGEGQELLARFNMPLELGIAMGRRFFAKPGPNRHDWLLLVPDGYLYQRFLSDLAGYDPERHDGTVAGLVPPVAEWLQSRPDCDANPSPESLLSALPEFRARRDRLKEQWGRSTWKHRLEAAAETARRL